MTGGFAPQDQEDLLRDYWREQSGQTLPLAKLSAWITAPAMLFLMVQDSFGLHMGWPSLLRLIAFIPCVIMLVRAYTTFRRDTTHVIRDYSIMLSLIVIQICVLTYTLWLMDPQSYEYRHGTTQGITVAALGAFLLAGGACRFLPLIVGAPFLLLMTLMLTIVGGPITDLFPFLYPAVVVLAVSLYSRPRERAVFVEFSMRRLAAQREAQLKESSEALSRTNAELTGFAHSASHDLQQPLQSISTHLDLIGYALERDDLLKGSVSDYYERVTGAAHRMSELIGALLAYVRADLHVATFGSVDLNRVLRDVEENLSSAIRKSGATIEISPLPVVRGDVHQLSSVLQNLVSNAIKYAHADRTPIVRVTAADEEDDVRITVADNGVGFDPQYAPVVFEAFRRLHSPGEYEGAGLGLAICERHIRTHRGEIGGASEPGVGSEFWFTLPKEPDGQ